jgi:hypothetical protein
MELEAYYAVGLIAINTSAEPGMTPVRRGEEMKHITRYAWRARAWRDTPNTTESQYSGVPGRVVASGQR